MTLMRPSSMSPPSVGALRRLTASVVCGWAVVCALPQSGAAPLPDPLASQDLVFEEADGVVAVEAEHFRGSDAGMDQDGFKWAVATDTPGYVGDGYVTTPVPDPPTSFAGWHTGCALTYDIEFTTSGSYAIWLRRRHEVGHGGENATDNSCFVGMDGMQVGGSFDNGRDPGSWGWVKHRTTMSVMAGRHTLCLRRREGGYKVDRIYLTRNGDTPTGDGPRESPREDRPQKPVAHAGSDQVLFDLDHDGAERVRLDGSRSRDPDGAIASYAWAEGGREIGSGGSPTVRLPVGTHRIALRVTDADGLTDTDTIAVRVEADVHVWQKVEITLQAEKDYTNPYTDVEVWVQLRGPGFDERAYGFWDGGRAFRVRVMATAPGSWSWTSYSNPADPGLDGKSGSFAAVAWTEEEKRANPNRRGTIRPTANGRALEYADGTPFFLLADTHWSAGTWRYPFKGKDPAPDYEPGLGMGFEEFIQHLKGKGFNSIGVIACFPSWDNDQYAKKLSDDAGVQIRAAWGKPGTDGRAMDQHDEDGNRSFLLPGKCDGKQDACADFDRINPAYWQSLDRKMDYMWANGFVPYFESVRRDHFAAWIRYHDFNESFVRFLMYLRARYSTHNFIYSLFHCDGVWFRDELDEALDLYYDRHGLMPFGQPTTVMANRSTLDFFGHVEDSPWLKIHTSGNAMRHHGIYRWMETQFEHANPIPVFNNEPYYLNRRANAVAGEAPPRYSERDSYFGRAQMYGNVLSGGLAGHVYGSPSWPGVTTGEPATPELSHAYWWVPFSFAAHGQMRYLGEFMLSEGTAYRDLLLASDDLDPRKSPGSRNDGLDGWAYMMRTADKRLALLYFENACDRATASNMRRGAAYRAQWFDPRTGEWSPAGTGTLMADGEGNVLLPEFPGGLARSSEDWALKLTVAE